MTDKPQLVHEKWSTFPSNQIGLHNAQNIPEVHK
jgi:hypothetical protein